MEVKVVITVATLVVFTMTLLLVTCSQQVERFIAKRINPLNAERVTESLLRLFVVMMGVCLLLFMF